MVTTKASLYFLLLIGVLCFTLQVFSHQTTHPNKSGFLFESRGVAFSVPLHVNVAMLGLNGDGYKRVLLSAADIKLSLENSLKACLPSCIETKKPTSVQFDITYHVAQMNVENLRVIEYVLKNAMRRTGLVEEGQVVYDIELTSIEGQLDEQLVAFVKHEGSLFGPGLEKTPYTVFVMNPDKDRMRPIDLAPGQGFIYRYRYNGGVPSQSWVAKQRYVAFDLASGPCSYGVTDAGEGTVSAGSLPSVVAEEHDDQHLTQQQRVSRPNLASVRFRAQLSSVVLSAIQQIFISDVQYEHLAHSHKLIVPIIVLRNHRRFDPFDDLPTLAARAAEEQKGLAGSSQGAPLPLEEFHINVEEIRAEVRRMLLPSQELVVVTGVHSLYDHIQLSQSFFRGIRGDTIHTPGPDGVYTAKTMNFIDSKNLVEDLKGASDILAATSIENAGVTPPPSLRGLTQEEVGHRVLPVFVFSVLGLPEELLIDHEHLYAADPTLVVALQTGTRQVDIPYFSEDGVVTVKPRNPTRAIIAGLATALGGLTNPYENFNTKLKAFKRDYLWATGHHPFGPFSNSTTLSQIYLDRILRNSILSRVTTALTLVRRAVRRVEDFSETVDPGADETKSEEQVVAVQRYLINPPTQQLGVLAQRLNEGLFGLESQLKHLAVLLSDYKLGDANLISASIVEAARAFYNYVENEINSASLDLECCQREYTLKQEASTVFWGRVRNIIYGFIFIFVLCFIYFISFHEPAKPGLSSSAQYRSSLRTRSTYGGYTSSSSSSSSRY